MENPKFYQMENGCIISNIFVYVHLFKIIPTTAAKQMKMESFKVIYNPLCTNIKVCILNAHNETIWTLKKRRTKHVHTEKIIGLHFLWSVCIHCASAALLLWVKSKWKRVCLMLRVFFFQVFFSYQFIALDYIWLHWIDGSQCT